MFPEFIEQVSEHRQIAETLGWQCGIWGSFFLITAWLIVIPGQAHPVEIEWVISATCGALGLFLMGCESWRHRNRTVLVRDGGLIAVFRRGRLDLTLSLSEIRSMKAGLVLMIKLSASLGLSTLLFLAIGITSVLRERDVSADSVICLCLGLASACSLACAAWTRFHCVHLRVPIKGGWLMAEETVLISNLRIGELFPEGLGVVAQF
jgi:hypothetical protein